ncbi:MAG: RagB/SusD family nutrient uptake outer membrane protein [Gemmatimonadaceae bacterium]|nr:RagB/SusD family nutrient uptake outer membrane protein [Gemmatimonadaceae bacterium]
MTTFLKKSLRRVTLGALLLVPALTLIQACTNLTEVPKDALTPDNAFKTDLEVLAGVASVYAGLRPTLWGYYNLSEITTDELLVPTRGNDWYDNGRWLEIHRQQWTENSGSALDDMNGTWNDLFSGVAKANLMIEVMNKSTSATKDQTIAELRTLRAWYYYMLMDFFGGVPLVTTTELAKHERVSRDSIFRFVEAELKASSAALPPSWPSSFRGRVTKGSADAILASLYLNAQVFTGTVTANSFTKGTARWTDAIAAADRVINSGVYSLATDWKKNFSIDNQGSPEHIFWISESSAADLGMSLAMRGLHYNQLSPEPWNGFATIADTYNAFDPNDDRRSIFLVGQQYSYNTGAAVKDRQGNPLIFTVGIVDATKAAENEGARLMKFPPLPGAATGNSHPNNYPFFRLAEMYLIKAEALNESGNTPAAIAQLNIIRSRHLPAGSLIDPGLTQAQARQAILNERLFELAGEGKRRQDLIRAGKYTDAHQMCTAPIATCTKAATQIYRILFPIPLTQRQSNPLLAQNPGY